MTSFPTPAPGSPSLPPFHCITQTSAGSSLQSRGNSRSRNSFSPMTSPHKRSNSNSSEHPLITSRKRMLGRSSSVSLTSSLSQSPTSSSTSLADILASLDAPLAVKKRRRRVVGDRCMTRCQECKRDMGKEYKEPIYMYRDESFCSEDCRDKRLTLDEIDELSIT
mmetsp:Transcript_18988/g.46622  ORF Transcript_18988/g.46622 Transcript_18988/m.46622 type:complete len:165 (+) Transcript_18988:200-694(+)